MQTRGFKLVALVSFILIVSLTGIRCRKGPTAQETEAMKPVALRWWRTFDDASSVQPIIEAYKALHPNVTIEYRKLRFEEFERELLDALAEDRGPDIVSIHNTWVRNYQSKLAPMPEALTIPFQHIAGKLKKEVVVTLKTTPTLSTRALKDSFVDTAVSDVLIRTQDPQGTIKEQIFGLPLALDTLVLYSNRDMLNLAGVPEPPKTWTEFQGVVKKLTKLNQEGKLIQSGAAIGTTRNVERAFDIVSLLMMQNGTEMTDASGAAAFHKTPALLQGRSVPPALEALTFYTDFANSQKEVYTWSADLPSSLEAFLAGKTAMFLGYAYHLPLIRTRSARINLAVTAAPQIEGNPEVHFANYWVEGITRKSKNQSWAWDFVLFATSPKQVTPYLEATKKPTALRALITSQLEHEEIGVFASEVLTAKSWYRGMNAFAAEDALLDAADAILSGADPRDILNIAAQRVNQTLR